VLTEARRSLAKLVVAVLEKSAENPSNDKEHKAPICPGDQPSARSRQ
jgi:hypothetical protein